MAGIKGRAETPEAKRETIERILRAWEQFPTLRLGQFIDNAMTVTLGAGLFDVEDVPLAARCEHYVKSHGKKEGG